MSYANLLMYSSVIPGYEDEEKEEVIDADDPRNQEKINKLFYG